MLLGRITTFAVLLPLAAGVLAQTPMQRVDQPIPHIARQDGRFALMVDGEPYLMLGAQMNNSSDWPAMLPKVWPTTEAIHANTLEAPIYWEQWEPTQGHFDPSTLHVLIDQAREHHVHLVLLWFGTWKNGSGHYTPPFIKLDEAEVPHVVSREGKKVDSLAPYSKVALKADSSAFAALMREVKAYDPQHTVLMVQVENEIGTWGSVRDFSPVAQRLFEAAVPEKLVAALHLQPGTWSQVFGKDADESFYAWSIARYVQQVVAAGKAEDPLPMYVNVETRNPINGKPGSYESGGAVDTDLPIWKAMAPAIDVYGPDMYTEDYDVYTKLLDIYHRTDNATFVPETSNSPEFARYFFATLGHQGIGFSPFGMDRTGYSNAPNGAAVIDEATIGPIATIYQIFEPMDRVVAELNFEGKLQAVSEDETGTEQTMDFGDWQAKVSYNMTQFGSSHVKVQAGARPNGGAMVARLGPNKFLVTGVHARVDFVPREPGKQRQWVRVEEGQYKAACGTWTGSGTATRATTGSTLSRRRRCFRLRWLRIDWVRVSEVVEDWRKATIRANGG